jgi:four helix bundle protein
MAGFEQLAVWQRAVELSVAIYRETHDLKDFAFRDQITRAGLSIPSNIAEGMERTTPADQCKFLDYARGSCGEVRTQAIVGTKAGLLANEAAQQWCNETKELAAMINGLIRSIRSRTCQLPTSNVQLPTDD